MHIIVGGKHLVRCFHHICVSVLRNAELTDQGHHHSLRNCRRALEPSVRALSDSFAHFGSLDLSVQRTPDHTIDHHAGISTDIFTESEVTLYENFSG